MKRVIILMILLIGSITLIGQHRTFVELVTNTVTSDYERTMEICDSINAIYVVSHFHSQDPFSSRLGLSRIGKYGGRSPVTVVRGYPFNNTTDLWSYGHYDRLAGDYLFTDFRVTGKMTTDTTTTITLDFVDMSAYTDHFINMFIVEDVGEHKRVLRQLFNPTGKSLTFDWVDEYVMENTKLIVTIENSLTGVIDGAFEFNFLDLFDTSSSINIVDDRKLKVYPNPVTDFLNIEGHDDGEIILIYDTQGRLVFKEQVFGKQIDVRKFSSGYYFLRTKKEVVNIIIQ